MRRRDEAPALVPVLSAGKHRSPRSGACFMEMASYLAGERWSDHPSCTHPLLAGLARIVNDHTTDEGRSGLVELIPSVIGLTSKDPRVDALIAWRCALTALPVVGVERQRVMAVAVIVTDRVLADLDRSGRRDLLPDSRSARAPGADGERVGGALRRRRPSPPGAVPPRECAEHRPQRGPRHRRGRDPRSRRRAACAAGRRHRRRPPAAVTP